MSYAYDLMKPYNLFFHTTTVAPTSVYSYQNWKSKLEGSSAYSWNQLCERLGEEVRYAVLRGMAVVGVVVSDWDTVFNNIHYENPPFQGMSRRYMENSTSLTWIYFNNMLAADKSTRIHYPPLCPEWLFPYGYTQRLYMQDVEAYWSNVHDDYFKPWSTVQLGQDSPEIARLKKIGETARREIDDVARHSAQHLKH